MGEKLDLIDAGSSAYVVLGTLLGSWDAGCARMGCGEDRGDLDCLASHPRRRTLGFITQTIYYNAWWLSTPISLEEAKQPSTVAFETHMSRRQPSVVRLGS